MRSWKWRRHLFLALFAVALFLFGLFLGGPDRLLPELAVIMTSQGMLITDYMALAGPTGALANAALVLTLIAALLRLTDTPITGGTLSGIGMVVAFSFAGQNLWAVCPLMAGALLYGAVRGDGLKNYTTVAILTSCLAPAVTYVCLPSGLGNPIFGILLGLVIGFLSPPLTAFTATFQNGLNLYSVGFSCGILALVMVAVMSSLGASPSPVLHWGMGQNLPISVGLYALCMLLLALGLFFKQRPPREVLAGYWALLKTDGRAPSDYLERFGSGVVLVNMAVNGAIATTYILATGGDLNGLTMGGILTIMAYSGYGNHAGNILPIMGGVALGSVFARWSLSTPTAQIAGLFGTTLAPMAGCFGWPIGILAGFLHSMVMLRAGIPAEGVNLFNNGFSGGMVVLVLYPVLTALREVRKKKAAKHESALR